MAKVPLKWDICPGQKLVAFIGHYIHQFTETWVMNYTFYDNPFFFKWAMSYICCGNKLKSNIKAGKRVSVLLCSMRT